MGYALETKRRRKPLSKNRFCSLLCSGVGSSFSPYWCLTITLYNGFRANQDCCVSQPSPCGEPAAVFFSKYSSTQALPGTGAHRERKKERMYKQLTSPSAQTTQPTVASEQHIKPACTFTQVTQQLFTNPTAPLPDLAQLWYWGFSSRKDYFEYLRREEFGGEPVTKPSDDPDGTLAKLVAQLGVPRRQRK
ncbi:uncharacterized protein EV422DRAFT_70253 [Fimicolochytrium jonesii]|uniref:uncharacterized protein n=1 Tax=Fimicolochytrium jonesii TaxID=1396493 RepID=UPI0022FE9FF5|nr:uncharacterized protein EV422DRAFT_70253 [Fimicolochytrium jonesii]KAI8820439.1 hypothetical protein EV422DRAFT_70253 [Fimicolochytrium jonesii]